jgi:hypothetical protein
VLKGKTMKIEQVIITTAQPMNGDTGSCEVAYFMTEGGDVYLCSDDGIKTSERAPIKAGETAELVAKRLLRLRWRSKAGGSNFNRPIPAAPPRGVA